MDRPWVIVLVGAGALVLGLGMLALVWLLIRPLALLFAAIVIAEALSPLVDWLARRLPRGLVIGLVFLTIFLIAGGIGWIVVPTLIAQVQQVVANGPELVDATRRWIDRLGFISSAQIRDAMSSNLDRVGTMVIALPFGVAASTFDILVVVFLSVYWLVGKPALRQFALSFFTDDRRWGAVFSEMGRSMGGYVRGSVINAAVIGVCDYIGLSLIGVQYPLTLALISAIGETIPVLGPIVAAVPALAIALLHSPTQALIVLIFKVALQQFEGHLLTPNIMRSQTDVPQLLVLFALVAGAAIGGILGALIAIPLAGALRVLVLRVLAPALRQRVGVTAQFRSDDEDSG